MPIDDALNARLMELEDRATELLEVVTEPSAREELHRVLRDVEEARGWDVHSELLPPAIVETAEARLRKVLADHAQGRT